ncbi:MAG: hypothetical protein QXL45_02545 [Candidatus Bathyarchaeia archaeon]
MLGKSTQSARKTAGAAEGVEETYILVLIERFNFTLSFLSASSYANKVDIRFDIRRELITQKTLKDTPEGAQLPQILPN